MITFLTWLMFALLINSMGKAFQNFDVLDAIAFILHLGVTIALGLVAYTSLPLSPMIVTIVAVVWSSLILWGAMMTTRASTRAYDAVGFHVANVLFVCSCAAFMSTL